MYTTLNLTIQFINILNNILIYILYPVNYIRILIIKINKTKSTNKLNLISSMETPNPCNYSKFMSKSFLLQIRKHKANKQ